MAFILITYLLTGAVLAGASLPLVLGKVKPNPWYGVRLPETMENEDLWYAANKFGGQAMVLVGSLVILVTLACYFIPQIKPETYQEICGGVTAVTVLIAAFVIYRFVQKRK